MKEPLLCPKCGHQTLPHPEGQIWDRCACAHCGAEYDRSEIERMVEEKGECPESC